MSAVFALEGTFTARSIMIRFRRILPGLFSLRLLPRDFLRHSIYRLACLLVFLPFSFLSLHCVGFFAMDGHGLFADAECFFPFPFPSFSLGVFALYGLFTAFLCIARVHAGVLRFSSIFS